MALGMKFSLGEIKVFEDDNFLKYRTDMSIGSTKQPYQVLETKY